jgi:hypothetical protein
MCKVCSFHAVCLSGVVMSASHDLSVAQHPILSLERPAPPSLLSLDTFIPTQQSCFLQVISPGTWYQVSRPEVRSHWFKRRPARVMPLPKLLVYKQKQFLVVKDSLVVKEVLLMMWQRLKWISPTLPVRRVSLTLRYRLWLSDQHKLQWTRLHLRSDLYRCLLDQWTLTLAFAVMFPFISWAKLEYVQYNVSPDEGISSRDLEIGVRRYSAIRDYCPVRLIITNSWTKASSIAESLRRSPEKVAGKKVVLLRRRRGWLYTRVPQATLRGHYTSIIITVSEANYSTFTPQFWDWMKLDHVMILLSWPIKPLMHSPKAITLWNNNLIRLNILYRFKL